jgi:hypothetical protein
LFPGETEDIKDSQHIVFSEYDELTTVKSRYFIFVYGAMGHTATRNVLLHVFILIPKTMGYETDDSDSTPDAGTWIPLFIVKVALGPT